MTGEMFGEQHVGPRVAGATLLLPHHRFNMMGAAQEARFYRRGSTGAAWQAYQDRRNITGTFDRRFIPQYYFSLAGKWAHGGEALVPGRVDRDGALEVRRSPLLLHVRFYSRYEFPGSSHNGRNVTSATSRLQRGGLNMTRAA